MRPRTSAARALVLLLACASAACARSGPSPDVPATGEALVAPYAPIRFGEPVAALVVRLPALAPTGWAAGDRTTHWDPTREAGLEIETSSGLVVSAVITFAGPRAREVGQALDRTLGPGRSCGGLPEVIGLYRPRLHRLPDGTAVTVLDKGKQLTLHVARPSGPAFDEAFAACTPDAAR